MTGQNLPSPTSQPQVSLSSSLQATCSSGREWDFESQDYRDKPWICPAEVDPRDKGEAKSKLPLALKLAAKADDETIRKWMASLGVMCAGQMSAGDAKAKISVYVPMLDLPACCFTTETLEDAGRKFKWFPSYGELMELLEPKARPARTLAFKLRKISEAPERTVRPEPSQKWQTMTPDQRLEFEQRMAAAKDGLRRGMTEQEKRESDQARTEAA